MHCLTHDGEGKIHIPNFYSNIPFLQHVETIYPIEGKTIDLLALTPCSKFSFSWTKQSLKFYFGGRILPGGVMQLQTIDKIHGLWARLTAQRPILVYSSLLPWL